MRQRCSLACALVHRPQLLLLDEPTVGVDPQLRVELWEDFRQMAADGTTIIVSSHVMDEAERCQRLGLIQYGKLLAEGTPDDIRATAGTSNPGRRLSQARGRGEPVMSGHRISAITKRLLQQFSRDRRTLALLFIAPIVILGLLGYLIRGSASVAGGRASPTKTRARIGATVASALARSSVITTTAISASDGEAKLKDGSLAAYIVLPSDFSSQAQAGTIAPEVHLEGSQPGTTAPVLQALQQALVTIAAQAPGAGVHVQPQRHLPVRRSGLRHPRLLRRGFHRPRSSSSSSSS